MDKLTPYQQMMQDKSFEIVRLVTELAEFDLKYTVDFLEKMSENFKNAIDKNDSRV